MNLMPPTASQRKGRRTDRRVRDEALHLPRVSFFQSTPPETFNRLTSKPIGILTLITMRIAVVTDNTNDNDYAFNSSNLTHRWIDWWIEIKPRYWTQY